MRHATIEMDRIAGVKPSLFIAFRMKDHLARYHEKQVIGRVAVPRAECGKVGLREFDHGGLECPPLQHGGKRPQATVRVGQASIFDRCAFDDHTARQGLAFALDQV